MPTKVAVVYYSSTGTTYELATLIAEGAESAGAEVRLRKVRELAPDEAIASNQGWAQHLAETQDVAEATADDVVWADAVVFGTPTRFGNVSSQLKQFLDTLGPQWQQGLLADKVYSGFVTTATAHGGQETTLQALYTSIHNFGGIIVAPGYTDPVMFATGNPYGVSFASGGGATLGNEVKAAARYQGTRVAKIAAALVAGRATA